MIENNTTFREEKNKTNFISSTIPNNIFFLLSKQNNENSKQHLPEDLGQQQEQSPLCSP